MKKLYALMMVFALLLPSVVMLGTNNASASGESGEEWLDGYDMRKAHTITYSGTVSTNYEVAVKVYRTTGTDGTEVLNGFTAGKVYVGSNCHANFTDIEFTASDGMTKLDYYMIASVSNEWALFWVEIPGFTTSYTFYIYFSNTEDTTSDGNGIHTFLYFDDFNSFNSTYWAPRVSYGSLSATCSGGDLILTPGTSTSARRFAVLSSITTYGVNNIEIMTCSNISAFTTNAKFGEITFGAGPALNVLGVSGGPAGYLYTLTGAQTGFYLTKWTTSWSDLGATGTTTFSAGTFYTQAVKINSKFKYGYTGDSSWNNIVSCSCTDSYSNTGIMGLGGFANPGQTPTVHYQYFIVRHCLATEPAHSTWGSVEGNMAPGYATLLLSETTGYQGITIDANCTSDYASSYVVNWGDGNSSTGANVSHTYLSAGHFVVTLNASNPSGYVLDSETVTINSVGFTSSPILRAYNETEYSYDFSVTYGTVSGDILPNGLSILDGVLVGTLDAILGDYSVSLKLVNQNYTTWQNFTITQVDIPPTNAIITISGDTYIETYSLVSVSGSAGGKNLNYTWHWNDLAQTVTYGNETSFTYLVSGDYTLELIVSNTGGTVIKTLTLHVLNFQFTTNPETTWRISAGEYHYRPNATTAYLGGSINFTSLPYGFYVLDGLIYGTFDSEGNYEFSISATLDDRIIYQNWTVRAYADFIPIDWSNDRIMYFVANWAVIIASIAISVIGLKWNIGLLCAFGAIAYILAIPVMWTGETLNYIAILIGALCHIGLCYKKFF